MQPIYIDLHIHTSEDANNLNTNYDIAELVVVFQTVCPE